MTTFKRATMAMMLVSMLGGPALAQSRGGSNQGRNNNNQVRVNQVRTTMTSQQQTRTGSISRGISLSQRAQGLVSSTRRSMESDIRQGATPFLEIIPKSDGIRMTQTQYPDYHSGRTANYKVTNLPGGQLDLVTLLPVSGHVGWTEAQSYAKSNKYNLAVTHADGTVERVNSIASQGFVTPHDLSLKLKPGKTTIQFWPDGSGGVYGYVAGRQIELHWDGK